MEKVNSLGQPQLNFDYMAKVSPSTLKKMGVMYHLIKLGNGK